MYVEILSGKFPDRVRVRFHEGLLHDKKFNVNFNAILPLVWRKKISIDITEIYEAASAGIGHKAFENDPETNAFLTELRTMLRGTNYQF